MRYTMTHIELYPREVRGKPTMKSMQIFSYFHWECSRVIDFQLASNDWS
jgi:hypothetical protein